MRAEFPAADSQASTLEDYFLALNASGMSLPVVTEEMGDTWIQGVASDPRKVAEFRTVGRVMGKCLEEGKDEIFVIHMKLISITDCKNTFFSSTAKLAV